MGFLRCLRGENSRGVFCGSGEEDSGCLKRVAEGRASWGVGIECGSPRDVRI